MHTPNIDLTAVIGHLRTQFSQARPVLFTGAGVSNYCRNVTGAEVPTGKIIKEQIWPICFPGEPADSDSTLQDVFAAARLRHPHELSALFQGAFSLNPASIPSWLTQTLELPWHRIYTLNIDDLPLALQRRIKLKRQIKMISANDPRLRSLKKHADEAELEWVCLNGQLADGIDSITFSAIQFGEKAAREEPWYLQFIDDLMYRPVIFVGTSLDEPPLWHFLAKRLGRKSGEDEYRPKSYLITPKISPAREIALREHNIVHVPLPADAFFQRILEETRAEAREGLSVLGTERTRLSAAPTLGMVDVTTEERSADSMYLFGAEPTWSDLLAGRAILRECDEALTQTIKALETCPEKKRLLIVHGTAGTGKSTSIRRAALAIAANHPCAWVSQADHTPVRIIVEGMNAPKSPSYLVIDDADNYGSELSSMISDVLKSKNNPLVIIGCASGRIDRVINPTVLKDVTIKEVQVPNLCDSDIDSLLVVLERDNALGELATKTPTERKRIFKERCGRQLIVAMIEATSDMKFDQKIWDEFSKLDSASKEIYAAVCVVSSQGFEISRSDLLMSLDSRDNSTLNALTRLTNRKLIFQIRNGSFIARHRVIADELVQQLASSAKLREVLYDVTWAISAGIDPQSPTKTAAHRLLIRLLNHDFLERTLGADETSDHYGRLERILANELNYWLQRGSHELQRDRIELAERFLNNARARNDRDMNTQTEYAYLLFKKALRAPDQPESPALVEQAIDLLRDNIWKRGHKDPHSFHVLAHNSIQCAKRVAPSLAKQLEFLEIAQTAVTEGCKLHPRNRHLVSLRQQLDIEMRLRSR